MLSLRVSQTKIRKGSGNICNNHEYEGNLLQGRQISVLINASQNATVTIKSEQKDKVLVAMMNLLVLAYDPTQDCLLPLLVYKEAALGLYGKEGHTIVDTNAMNTGVKIKLYENYAPSGDERIIRFEGPRLGLAISREINFSRMRILVNSQNLFLEYSRILETRIFENKL